MAYLEGLAGLERRLAVAMGLPSIAPDPEPSSPSDTGVQVSLKALDAATKPTAPNPSAK